jgi:hypothetical protein
MQSLVDGCCCVLDRWNDALIARLLSLMEIVGRNLDWVEVCLGFGFLFGCGEEAANLPAFIGFFCGGDTSLFSYKHI